MVMTPNAEAAHALADALAVTDPDVAMGLIGKLSDDLTAYALCHGCCADCAALFSLAFLRLVNSRLQVLASQRAVH